MKGLYTFISFLFFCNSVFAQGSILPMGSPDYQIVERLKIKYESFSEIHTTLKPYNRIDVCNGAIALLNSDNEFTERDKQDLQYLIDNNQLWLTADQNIGQKQTEKKIFIDSTHTFYKLETTNEFVKPTYTTNEKPLFGVFYKTPANLLEVKEKYFRLAINPLLNLQIGKSKEEDGLMFANQRGIELYGDVDNKVYFYSNLVESQQRFPNFISKYAQFINAVPGNGNLRYYQSSVFGKVSGFDYMNAQGYIGFNVSKHVGIQLGHGRNFLGDGYRSLLLSDFSHNYFYLKLNTKVWKFHYQNIFAELTDLSSHSIFPGDQLLGKKYGAFHMLSYNINKKLNIGLFESVIFNRSKQFEFQYLNPLIFYRTVELFVGSPDNAMIGFNSRYDLNSKFSFYGQFLLDEFIFKNIKSQNGSWTNKYGAQIGVKYVNAFGINQLDMQLEYNFVRPFTYMHFDSSSNYVHYNQPLAHPLGANFKEMIGIIQYRPSKNWNFELRCFNIVKGFDDGSSNWGGNIIKDYNSRSLELGNEIGQGVKSKIFLLNFDVSYRLYHQFYIDFNTKYRIEKSDNPANNLNTTFFSGGIRLNIAKQKIDI
ncbi:MAG: hypothetical protein IPL95_04220 [Saprospiraceae bacterium]|nr:hypothetical protein [Saprospiraceae bacterium]